MEGKRSITSRSRPHDQALPAEGRTATAKSKDSESDCEQGVEQSLSRPISMKKGTTSTASGESPYSQSHGPRPPLPPRSRKHVEFSKSSLTVCSSSAKHASLPCFIQQTHSPVGPSAKNRLHSIVTPNSQSLMKERLEKPQTPPKPHIPTMELTLGPNKVRNLGEHKLL